MAEPYRLITIPPSHYCEKARWALERAGVPFAEEGHPPLFHWRATKKVGGGRTTPVLVADKNVFPDSTDILEFLQDRPGDDVWRPYPTDPDLRCEAAELEELFDTRLGPHTRRLAYFYLLQHRALFLQSVLPNVGAGERRLFTIAAPVVSLLMKRAMNINPESAKRSLERVHEVFSGVSKRLADGRNYLVGNDFSTADLTFASLAAPAVLPPNYGSPLPTLDEVPDAMREVVDHCRATPAGEFALKMYRDHR